MSNAIIYLIAWVAIDVSLVVRYRKMVEGKTKKSFRVLAFGLNLLIALVLIIYLAYIEY
ncbi:MAG: hypothetical protein JXR19_02970 [Bacteroidia bacterium]